MELNLVHRARNRRTARALDAEIEIGLRRLRDGRTVTPRYDGTRQGAGNLRERGSSNRRYAWHNQPERQRGTNRPNHGRHLAPPWRNAMQVHVPLTLIT